jgi:hypothetical protein
LTVGCKKKEEPAKAPAAAAAAKPTAEAKPVVTPAPAAQVLPDVALQPAEGILGWLSMKSFNATFDAVEAIGGKVGAVPPGASLRGMAMQQLTVVVAQLGVKDLDWWDKTRPMHVVSYDAGTPAAAPEAAAPGAAPAEAKGTGIFMVLPVTQREAVLAAMTTAKKGVEADGHDAMLSSPTGEPMYFDFADKHVVLTVGDKGRAAKVMPFAKQLAAFDPPAVLYGGVSMPELVKAKKAQIDGYLTLMEQQGKAAVAAAQGGKGAAAAEPAKAEANPMDSTVKSVRQWMDEGARLELLVHADLQRLRLEVRMQGKEGTALAKRLAAGRGRHTQEIANLLPANSYLSMAFNQDPAAQIDEGGQVTELLQQFLGVEGPVAEALSRDLRELAKLSEGTSAVAAYPDGEAALGLMMVTGVKDGAVAVPLGKKVMGALAVALMQMSDKKDAAAKPTANEAALKAALEQSAKEGKLDPLLAVVGPEAEAMGVKLTTATTRDGDVSCDSLDVAMDWTKLPPQEAERVKSAIGSKTSLVLCGGKTKVVVAVGPSALEKAKAAVAGKPGGLVDGPVYKAAVGETNDGSLVMYLNPGALLGAFKALLPSPSAVPGDKAVVASCLHRERSYACGVDLPLDVLQALVQTIQAMAPAARGGAPIGGPAMAPPIGGPAMAPPVGGGAVAPAPTGK